MKFKKKKEDADWLKKQLDHIRNNINDLGNRMHRIETAERERAEGKRGEEALAIYRKLEGLQHSISEINDWIANRPRRRWWQR